MTPKANLPASLDDAALQVRLLPDANHADLARLFNDFSRRKCYRVCLDVSAVSHLGTVEFRVLGNFAESFKQHGGFLKLEHATASVTALVREFGLTELLATCAINPPSDIILPKNG